MRKRLAKKLSKCDVCCGYGQVMAFQRCQFDGRVTKVLYSFWECTCCRTVWNWGERRKVGSYGLPK